MKTISINNIDFVFTPWNKAPGKERVYIASQAGKEYGYWDVPSKQYVHTGKAWPSPAFKNAFLAAVNDWAATYEVSALAVPETTTQATGPRLSKAADPDRASHEKYAAENMDLSVKEIRLMDDDALWQAVEHDL